MSVYHDEVEIEDFEYDEEEDTYYYPCPCGDRFQISKEELRTGVDVATCPSCSLVIKVIYDQEQMSGRGRGRGRGRGFDRGKPMEQINMIPVENAPSTQNVSPYPSLKYFPATLSNENDYEELNNIQNQILLNFQSSNFYMKFDDENARLFSSQGESSNTRKISLNFDWDYFPLELRPVNKRKLKNEKEILASLRDNKMVSIDLSWLDKLEEKEQSDKIEVDRVLKEEPTSTTKKKFEGDDDEEEVGNVDEFDDEELDGGTDYNTNYFDNGEGYLDEDEDLDEGPCF
ncbi:hypothetical protein PGB90_010142 [Kerria lacca]